MGDMTMTMREKLIEAAAKQLCKSGSESLEWDYAVELGRDGNYRAEATLILDAILTTLKAPDEAMKAAGAEGVLQAAADAGACIDELSPEESSAGAWQAMIDHIRIGK